ncbi:dihydrofolate reductase family protein [Mucilaginibacter sp. KACC 22773]|uniref:dihydrofolate reductase family protein n=1 Tax=Mucilaginibacter sp. KACC 22773 TaxID=3025671 RepID=UPI0023667F16|nr:dihydrofolate reductase family protein [Mucilaginibacter sp. KACC 22773]WDF80844.1 dihydrofolate reductase family protein [Mucilaginibacter sp. KACC 22773]
MRKIIVTTFITLDGVMQAPGSPEEDPSGGFKYGGWSAPYGDEVSGKAMQKQMEPADLLLGRKTFEIFASYWPQHSGYWPGINEVTKYVLSATMQKSDWQNTTFLTSVADIEKLKNTDGADIKVWGSSELVHLLLAHDLVDELWLKIYPVLLGEGKRLFNNSTIPAAFTLTESVVTPGGVIFANYKRAGEVKTGIIGA